MNIAKHRNSFHNGNFYETFFNSEITVKLTLLRTLDRLC
jgi:hypothetical protein